MDGGEGGGAAGDEEVEDARGGFDEVEGGEGGEESGEGVVVAGGDLAAVQVESLETCEGVVLAPILHFQRPKGRTRVGEVTEGEDAALPGTRNLLNVGRFGQDRSDILRSHIARLHGSRVRLDPLRDAFRSRPAHVNRPDAVAKGGRLAEGSGEPGGGGVGVEPEVGVELVLGELRQSWLTRE